MVRLFAGVLVSAALAEAAAGSRPAEAFKPMNDPVSPDGVRAVVDLPVGLHLRNTGGMGVRGPGTGSGLCVFTSCEVAGRWQSVRQLDGLQKWMTKKPGGGWPQKLDDMLRQFCAEKGVALPPYVQHTGGDVRFLELAMKTRRAVCVTYGGRDDFYPGPIAHMVVLAHLDETRAAILDNNRPGVVVWMARQEFLSRWSDGRMNLGWAVVFLNSPPPPGADSAVPQPPKEPKVDPKPSPPRCPGPNCPRNPHWQRVELYGGEVIWKLYDGGKLVGVHDDRGWHPATSADGWQREAEGSPPVAPPGANYGIDVAMFDRSRPRYWVNGVEATEVETCAAMAGPELVDDSGLPYLTVVSEGGKADVPAGKYHLHSYGPSDWPVTTGRVKAGVTTQDRSGKVLYHADEVTAATVAEAVRHTDPDYKPTPPTAAPKPRPKADPTPDEAPPPRPKPDGCSPCRCPGCPCHDKDKCGPKDEPKAAPKDEAKPGGPQPPGGEEQPWWAAAVATFFLLLVPRR